MKKSVKYWFMLINYISDNKTLIIIPALLLFSACNLFSVQTTNVKKNIDMNNFATNSTVISSCQNYPTVNYIISNRILHKIDDCIFGTFMERASWYGEFGIESAIIPGTHNLQPKVKKKLKEMKIPILRFPGGSDVDFINWTDMIGNVPGRTDTAGAPLPRPVTIGHMGNAVSNWFGYDELYKLSTNLGSQIILTVNFGDAVLEKKSLSKAALHAASLVAYCNAKVGTALPKGMENWPAIRSKNGFPKPFGVKYFQIGNETWFFSGKLSEKQYAKYVKTYVEKMKEVDPSIKILVDAISDSHVKELKFALGKNIDYIVQHDYLPWILNNKNIEKNGKPWTIDKLSEKDVWYAWVGIPNSFNSAGESIIDGTAVKAGRKKKYKVAITEWNFAGWWEKQDTPLGSYIARGLGSVGFIHAFMRAGDIINIACQSMTVGKEWGIAAIMVSQEQAFDPYFTPTGNALAMYSKYHGNNFLEMKGENIPTYKQPFKMNVLKPRKKIAVIDALATENESNIYFHVINRDFSKDIAVNIDVSAFSNVSTNGIHRKLQGTLHKTLKSNSEIGYFTDTKFTFNGKNVNLVLPKQSVSIIQFEK